MSYNSKTKLKNWICDKIQKLKMWQGSKIQNVKKLKNSIWDKTYKFKRWQNSKIKMGHNLKCEKVSINNNSSVTVLSSNNVSTPYMLLTQVAVPYFPLTESSMRSLTLHCTDLLPWLFSRSVLQNTALACTVTTLQSVQGAYLPWKTLSKPVHCRVGHFT